MDEIKDTSLTLLQTLVNATGAEFEDEKLAVDIIFKTITEVVKNNAVLRGVSESALEWWKTKDYEEKSSLLYKNGFSSNSHTYVKDHHVTEIYLIEHSR